MVMRKHDRHFGAWSYWRRREPYGCHPDGACCSGLHVRIVPLAERKPHAKLRIELSEFLQADELVLAPGAGTDVQRDAELVVGDASHDNAPTFLLRLDDTWSAGTRALFTDTN